MLIARYKDADRSSNNLAWDSKTWSSLVLDSVKDICSHCQ
jgi:hypothetical protein